MLSGTRSEWELEFQFRKLMGKERSENEEKASAGVEHEVVTSLAVTPMHQAGLPVAGSVHYDGEEVNFNIAEELIDRTKVSFIETSKPSTFLVRLSKQDPVRVMHIMRAIRYKEANVDHVECCLAASAHYYHAMVPTFTVDEYINLFASLLDMKEDFSEQRRCLLRIADPIMSLEPIPLGTLPAMVQMGEVSLPEPEIPEFYYDRELIQDAKSHLAHRNISLLKEEEQGALLHYFRQHEKNKDILIDDIIKIVYPRKEKVRMRGGGKKLTTPIGGR